MSRILRARRAVAARVLFPILLLVAAIIAIPLATPNFADDPPPSGGGDMDGDNIKDKIEPDPNPPGPVPGEVEIHSGASGGSLIVTIRGQQPNDRFGYSVAVVDDLNLDGHQDLIVGAPMDTSAAVASTGCAYVFFGPFTDSGPIEISAANADFMYFAPYAGEYGFGERVAPASDIDGDNVTDLRIRCWFLDANQVETMRTYFVSGFTGDLIYVVNGDSPYNPWLEIPGDTDGDGDCDQADINRVIDNLGLAGNPGDLTPYDGDLNGDGIVNGVDLAIAESNSGGGGFHKVPIPCNELLPNYVCIPDCDNVPGGVPGNLIYDCGNPGIGCIPCPPLGDNGPTWDIDINQSEVAVTQGSPTSPPTWTILAGADLIDVLSGYNQQVFRFRPLAYGLVKLKADVASCFGACGAIYQFNITCVPAQPCDVEITPPGAGAESLAVCVLSQAITLTAETEYWDQGLWGAALEDELIEVLSQPTDQQFVFSPRQLGMFYLHVQNTHCGNECHDYLEVYSVWIDSDGDGLPDGLELGLELDPFNMDSDGDGTSDAWEDSDGDGLLNILELSWGFDASNPDTDGDGIPDGDEDPDEGDGGIEPPCSATLNGIRFGGNLSWEWGELPESIAVCNDDEAIIIELHTFDGGNHHWSVLGNGGGSQCVVLNGNPNQNRNSPPFVIDGGCVAFNGGHVTLALNVTDDDGNVCTDTLTINVPSVNLEMSNSGAVLVNSLDMDHDGLPGLVDGFDHFGNAVTVDNQDAASQFIPLSVHIGAFTHDASVLLNLSYSASDPAGITATQTQPFVLPPGSLRVWTKPGNAARNPSPVGQGGDFVPPGLYLPDVLGLSSSNSSITLFVEAIRPSQTIDDATITVQAAFNGTECAPTDEVQFTTAKVELWGRNFGEAGFHEVCGLVATSVDDPAQPPTPPGLTPGAYQTYELRIYDPRPEIDEVTLDGEPLALTNTGGCLRTPEFVCLGDNLPPGATLPPYPAITLEGDSTSGEYNPGWFWSSEPDLDDPLGRDEFITKHIIESVEEMEAEEWVGAPPPTTNSFGNEVHDRVSTKIAQNNDGRWFTNVYVAADDHPTQPFRTILSIGQSPPGGTTGTTEIDVLRVKEGCNPQIGALLDQAQIDEIYEIKTSVEGKIKANQRARLRQVRGGDIKISMSKRRWTFQSGWHAEARVTKYIKIIGLIGLASAAYATINVDVYDDQVDDIILRLDAARAEEPGLQRKIAVLAIVGDIQQYLNHFDPTDTSNLVGLGTVYYMLGQDDW